MPGIEDWLNDPLGTIQNLFDTHGASEFAKHVNEYFHSRLQNKVAYTWIPSLNDIALDKLKANSLVRYRCMIQDMFDPEFYLGAYEVSDTKTLQTCMKSGKYKDVAECIPSQEIKLDSKRNVTMDRQTLYCVPIPAETEWVKTLYYEESGFKGQVSSDIIPRQKRRLEPDQSDTSSTSIEQTVGSDRLHDTHTTQGDKMEGDGMPNTDKRTRQEPAASAPNSTAHTDLNFPLSTEKGPACLIKVYDKIDEYKLNDLIEFVGILSVDPTLAEFPEHSSPDSNSIDASMDIETAEERHARAPPPSLVPRLHVLLSNKLSHNNPLLPGQGAEITSVQEEFTVHATDIRKQLLSCLESVTFGDTIAAEYLLCHLLSSVKTVEYCEINLTRRQQQLPIKLIPKYSTDYARADVMPLGKLSLNLIGCPKESEYPRLLQRFLSHFLTKCHYLPMTLENMNKMKFIPVKDYTANRLRSGILQLGDKTQLVVDETALQPGQLDTNGVKNITALGNLINWQRVEYDFSFHRQEFHTNVPVLVLSEGKSLLPSDCHMPLSAKVPVPDDLREYFSSIAETITHDALNQFRCYFSLMSPMSYSMSDKVQNEIQDDFVNMRRQNTQSMTVDDFQALLSLVRLLSLSHGMQTADLDLWKQAKSMDLERKRRLSSLPQQQRS